MVWVVESFYANGMSEFDLYKDYTEAEKRKTEIEEDERLIFRGLEVEYVLIYNKKVM